MCTMLQQLICAFGSKNDEQVNIIYFNKQFIYIERCVVIVRTSQYNGISIQPRACAPLS